MIRLLLVDDQSLSLSFLESCFSDKNKYEIIGAIKEAGFAYTWCAKKEIDAVVMDIQTKEDDINGIKVAAEIKSDFPDIKVMLISGFDEVSYVDRCKKAGADGFVSKDNTIDFFKEALDKIVNENQKVFPEKLPHIPVIDGENDLTEREVEILRLVCMDFSNKEIADKLFITPNTVNYHIKNLLRKTGKKGRTGLIAYVIAGGWINPDM